MRSHFERRQKSGDPGKRIMFYIHGGAYFFGSVDEHRYQLQRHARKLEARVFAPRYRLAPQFPFPCGLFDCLAAYLYLLTKQDSSTIVLAGDSAGGGMVLSLLVILRDQALPLPAGAVLISPWVDLTHSFPSVSGDNSLDYIPAHGFLARPSRAWPPPNADDMENIAAHAVERAAEDVLPRTSTQLQRHKAAEAAAEGIITSQNDRTDGPVLGLEDSLSITISNRLIHIKDQIQMYTTNSLIFHPLVSPVLQPSLGGLPPLLILTGGGEVLRDEQIYLAHKASNPQKYPPGSAHLRNDPHSLDLIHKFKPTDVQLQVWDDLCHVPPTLSFTRPAKYMYRSIAQFSAWALACAQETSIEIPDDDSMSLMSSSSSISSVASSPSVGKSKGTKSATPSATTFIPATQIGKAGDPIPPFKSHMIRQRVDRHGNIYPLTRASQLPACQMSPDDVGVIKAIPVQRWLDAKSRWDIRYAKEKRKVQKQRIKEMAKGYRDFPEGDVPPPSALAGRRGVLEGYERAEKKKKKNWGMSLWGKWGNKHDERTMEREKGVEKDGKTSTTTTLVQPDVGVDGDEPREVRAKEPQKRPTSGRSRSRSRTMRRRQVSDLNQRTSNQTHDTGKSLGTPRLEDLPPLPNSPGVASPTFSATVPAPDELAAQGNNDNDRSDPTTANTITTVHTTTNRPYENGVAYPFKLSADSKSKADVNPSTVTLHDDGDGNDGEEKVLTV